MICVAEITVEFKRDAAGQVEDQGYPVRDDVKGLCVSIRLFSRDKSSFRGLQR